MPIRWRLTTVAVVSAALMATGGAPALAGPGNDSPVKPRGQDDYCGQTCHDVLPPGQNGHANFFELLGFLTTGSRPKHNSDQLARYESLVRGYPSLSADTVPDYFGESGFGVAPADVERRYSPRADVTIVRDKQAGIPHVYGRTRAGTMFGAGYAGAEDRLFLMDLLRRVGRGELTPFAGGSPSNRAFEQEQWTNAPYTEADLQRQFDQGDDLYGEAGRQLQDDVRAYVEGVNAYIGEQHWQVWKRPGEYAAIGRPEGPEPWRVTDVIATASLVGSFFGRGGGSEVDSAVALLKARERFGADLGTRVWEAFRSADDPEADTTLHDGQRFRYGEAPANPAGRALPDGARVVRQPIMTDPTGSASWSRPGRTAVPRVSRQLEPLRGLFGDGVGPRHLLGKRNPAMSNALVISARESATGHPLGLFGSQAGYFAPQLLMQQELQGPGVSARGAAFVGVNMYVMLGRGQDYAWSATTAGQDIVDTFAVELCEPDGSTPSLASMSYRYEGACLPLEILRKRNDWRPTLADGTPAGGYTLEAQRTKLGVVTHRGTVGGTPVAFTRLRSTYQHEGDVGIGFSMFNDPARVRSARDFQLAASRIGYTFNWFYLDAEDTAYFNSGDNPVRAEQADPDLPTWGRPPFLWQGFDPDRNTARYTPFAEHPQDANQDFYTSWNNKQAVGFRAADSQFGYGPVHRVKPLTDRVRAGIAGPATMDRVELVQAMADAATVDLRGDAALPHILAVIDRGGPVEDPELRDALAALRTWMGRGAHRIDRDGDRVYDAVDAIRYLDAWWPRLIRGQFAPTLGAELFGSLTSMLPIDEPAGRGGSAWQAGWYSYLSKDLRTLLGEQVQGRYPLTFCGQGDLAACRSMLLATLKQAIAVPAAELYRAEGCTDGDAFCHDAIGHQKLGGIDQPLIHWQNRPTHQQLVEFPRRR